MKMFYVLKTDDEYYTIYRFDRESAATEFIRINNKREKLLEMVNESSHLVAYAIANYGDRFPVSIIREYYDRRWN